MGIDLKENLDNIAEGTKEIATGTQEKVSEIHEKYVSKVIPDCGKYGDVAKFGAELIPGVSEYNALVEGDWTDFAISAGFDVAAVGIGLFTASTGTAPVKAAEAATKKAVSEMAEAGAKKAVKEVAEEGAEKLVKEGTEKIVKESAEKATKEVVEEGTEKVAKETIEKGVKETVKEGTKKTTKEVAEKTVKEISEESIEKTAKEVAEEDVKKETKEIVVESTKKELKEASGVTEKASKESIEKEASETVESKTENILDDIKDFDANGKKYRSGKELLPDESYEINGYKYETDSYGRITSAEGNLQLKDHTGRKTINDTIEDIGKGFQKETDQRAHLIGDQFNGSNGLENIVLQDAKLNQGEYKKMENMLAKEVADGKDVYYKVEPIYESDSFRPTHFACTYSIDGEKTQVIFENGSV